MNIDNIRAQGEELRSIFEDLADHDWEDPEIAAHFSGLKIEALKLSDELLAALDEADAE